VSEVICYFLLWYSCNAQTTMSLEDA